MTGQQLKNSILQLAIQGGLVAQDPADEPASVLLQRIRQEKQRLVKEGKLKKKDLTTTPITEEEKPFDIPETWEWVRFSQVVKFATNLVPPSAYSDYKHIAPDNIEKGTGKLLECKTVKEDKVISNNHLFYKGQIIYSKIRPLLRKCVKAPFDGLCSADMYPLVSYADDDFLMYILLSDFFNKQVAEVCASRVKMPKINQEELSNILLPLPPLSEQRRIVARIEELMPLVEAYGKAQEELEALNAGLPEALKKSILQEAIQGRLVPQDANDEPASVLLARIRKEKEQLVKAGKLKKKDLTTTPITEEEKPFDIPETWEWCRLGDVFSHNNGKQLNRADNQGEYHDYITTSNLYWDRFELKEVRQMLFTEDELVRCTATKGDLLVCEGGDVGRSAIWDYDYDICIQNHIHRVRAYLPLCTRFFLYLLMYNKFVGLIGGKGIGIQGFSAKALHNTLVALPPLSEQRRIVAKIENLFAAIDQMKDLH